MARVEESRIVVLIRGNDQMLVFGPQAADDRIGTWQEMAPEMLALGAAVSWFAEDPSGRILLRVDERLPAALLAGDVAQAAALLGEALARRQCAGSVSGGVAGGQVEVVAFDGVDEGGPGDARDA